MVSEMCTPVNGLLNGSGAFRHLHMHSRRTAKRSLNPLHREHGLPHHE